MKSGGLSRYLCGKPGSPGTDDPGVPRAGPGLIGDAAGLLTGAIYEHTAAAKLPLTR